MLKIKNETKCWPFQSTILLNDEFQLDRIGSDRIGKYIELDRIDWNDTMGFNLIENDNLIQIPYIHVCEDVCCRWTLFYLHK